MQVFTFCEENYAKSTGAHKALSEIEQHEWYALTTVEGFHYAKNTGYTLLRENKRIYFVSDGQFQNSSFAFICIRK